jgi:hypothetical protein
MEDLQKYYANFNSEELQYFEDKNREFNVLFGMAQSLKIVENSLGPVHKTTIELRKKMNEQNDKFNSVDCTDALFHKLLNLIDIA